MALDRQINLFKVDTNAFLTDNEKQERKKLIKLKKIQSKIKKRAFRGKSDKYISMFVQEHRESDVLLTKYENFYIKFDYEIKKESARYKEFLLQSAKDAVEYNNTHTDKHIRCLDEKYLSYIDKTTKEKRVNVSNVISMFESTLSRSFGIRTNELTYDIFIMEIFYYDIAQDLIINGFDYNNRHYVYFSSSAGQIRTKKAVFVEEEKYNQCKMKLMCGLTTDSINSHGGMNINKYLAYLALSNSATDLWKDVFGLEFDINKCIVVNDFETIVKCKVDNIDYETYEITPDIEKDIPIPHTDGCGMILNTYSSKNFMVRLPWIKGLLGSFDYIGFIKEHNCSPMVTDIWGKSYNVIEDDIQVIFTKSQLKMYKFYSSWDEYKTYFTEYGCEACICNMEEDRISDAKINYQMLQTLYDATEEEIANLCKKPNDKIKNVSSSLKNSLEFFGVYMDNNDESKKDFYQKSLKIYPELLNDPSARDDLRDLKNSLVNKYRGAKLDVIGKFTFVLPDLYAFCEWLFLKKEIPTGLLSNTEVFCRLYKTYNKLDCLRSPHLYIEHAVRNNVCNKEYNGERLDKWFSTDAIYTSTYDLISRILQFDVDGDRLLVLAQSQIIEMAERVMRGVNPLYYEMKKAKAELITNQSLYNGLKLAFTGGNIGTISNDITKIWNSGEINEEALKAVRWLCMETNFTIDYAKTLFKPTRPQYVDEILKKYGKKKVPLFFYYAKDKRLDQVDSFVEDEEQDIVDTNRIKIPTNISKQSTINKIVATIKDNKNMFSHIKNLADIDYTILLQNHEDNGFISNEVNLVFDRWNKKYGNNVNLNEDDDTNKNNLNIVAQQVKYDLNVVESDDNNIVNSLVRFLYQKKSTRKKKLLWYIYGEQLYNNLLHNIDTNIIYCSKCGKRINIDDSFNGECKTCKNIYEKIGTKIIQCVDCGRDVEVDASSRRTRCDTCYKKERSRINAEYRKKTSSF